MIDESKSGTLLRKATDQVRRISEDLLGAVQMDTATVAKDSVQPLRGIYIWRFKSDGSLAYIGVGLGKKGLHQRIIGQHLSPSYTKSVFRKAIERQDGVGPGRDSVQFIRSRFTLAFVICSEETPEIVKAAEALLIAALRPKYNKTNGELPTTHST